MLSMFMKIRHQCLQVGTVEIVYSANKEMTINPKLLLSRFKFPLRHLSKKAPYGIYLIRAEVVIVNVFASSQTLTRVN